MLHFGAGRKYPRKLIADYISSMSFTVPLTSSAILSRGFGAGSYTRATTATIEDHESVVRYCLSGEARFKKSRRVRNLLSNSEDLSGWIKSGAGSISSGASDPIGGNSAFTFTAGTAGEQFYQTTTTLSIGDKTRNSIWIRRRTGSGTIGIADRSGGSYITVPVTTSWQRLCADVGTNTNTTALVAVQISVSGDSVDVWHPQAENVTGQSNQAPAAYVSVGAPKLNELTFTNDIDNAAWLKSATGTGVAPVVTANAGIAPDGTMSADQVVFNTAAGTTSGDLSQITRAATTLIVGNTYTSGIYVQGTAGTKLVYRGVAGVTYQLATLTGGWDRLAVPEAAASATSSFEIGIRQSVSGHGVINATATVLVWGAQINPGATVTPYFPVGNVYPFHGAFVDGVKYFDTTNGNTVNSNVVTEVAGTPLATAGRGYLPEDSKTNLLLRSQDFTTTWVNVNSSETANAIIAPDGTLTGTKLLTDATLAQHRIEQTPVSSAVAQSFSVFAKAAEYSQMVLRIGLTGSLAYFDLSAGTVVGSGAGFTTEIKAYPNGWYRCTINVAAPAANDVCRINVSSGGALDFVGAVTDGIYIWGAQLELGANPSTYIPTTTGAVTRNADSLTYPAAGNAGTSGTLFVECGPSPVVNVAFNHLFDVSDGSANNFYNLQSNVATAQAIMFVGGVSQGSASTVAWTNGTSAKIASRFGTNTIQFAKDGTLAIEDTAASIPASVSVISIGTAYGGTGARANMPIQMVGISPKLFNNLQLIQSTN